MNMQNDATQSERQEPPAPSGKRNALLFFGGLFLLGLALAVLLFGGSLFQTQPRDATADLPQVPAFEDDSAIAALSQDSPPLNVGDTAHDFTLQDLDGNPVTLSALRGRPVIVNFWATWCAPCRLEMPELQQAYTAYANENLAILALNQFENPTAVRSFFRDELGLTFTPVMDVDGAVADRYGAIGLPSTYFIDANGVVTAVHRGVLTREQIDGYLADMQS